MRDFKPWSGDLSSAELAACYGVNRSTICRWLKPHLEAGTVRSFTHWMGRMAHQPRFVVLDRVKFEELDRHVLAPARQREGAR